MNRIWLEIEHPAFDQGERVKGRSPSDWLAIGGARATLLSRMIERLDGSRDYCQYDDDDCKYTFGGLMGFVTASDHGHWFNLDFLGKAAPTNPLDTDENVGSVAP